MVCFPRKKMYNLEQSWRGGLSKLVRPTATSSAANSIAMRIKFGYGVTGLGCILRVLANKRRAPGDRLLFHKSLGTGVISTPVRKHRATGVDHRRYFL